ncbi:M1 family metallopeptidase [Acidianus sp. RZ1]|uniref:M1 family metallopeptidase n=1 Tax=Acidianus sp. RZ1 TaxID=1540082 RepID=UPI0014916A3F|nr:M1 family metallopeptidase [Acidianus sp. RZ1]NON61783.1 M1 family metallopeptidase [Acidianus sp. RZ1]
MQIEYYNIFIDFDFKNLKYSGIEKIKLNVDDELVLDAEGIEVTSVKINGNNINFAKRENSISIPLGKFTGEIEVDFQAKVRDDLVGIYVAPYGDSYMVSTQFESSHARKFIPCVDNPAYKAEFKLSVKVDEDLDVISNTPVERIVRDGNRKIIEFMKTPRMSTYLLYLGIGKFEVNYDFSSSPIVGVITTPGKISRSDIPKQFGRQFISFYENYFGVKYPLPKEDLIAVPEFAFGAMENWGAITFRETALLADKTSSLRQTMRVAEVIAHELAHQWFGDLVTMKWWDDLWLNESFATFMSYKAVNTIKPEWDYWGQFVLDETAGAMLKDSLHITHPIEAKVEKIEDIEQIFDDISYGKGASILRMIEAYLGEEDFRKGIRSYLEQYKYSNAKGENLWKSLKDASGKPVDRIMESWIKQEGYPLITVSINGSKVKLEQKRFMQDGSTDEKTYLIPITIEINGKRTEMLLDEKNKEIDVGTDIKSLKVNLNKAGFYRVKYADLNRVSEMNGLEKFGLVNDYFYLLLAKQVTFQEYEKVIRSMLKEYNYLPVREIADQLYFLFLVNKEKYGGLALEFHKSQLEIWATKTDPLSRLTYASLVENMVMMDNDFAKDLSKEYTRLDSVDPNLKDAVVMAYAASGGERVYDEILNAYRTQKFDEEKQRYLKALLSFREGHLVVNTLSLSFTGDIKKQDIVRILPLASSNPYTRGAVWTWLKTYIDFPRKSLAGTGIFGRVLSDTLPLLGIGRVEEVKKFFSLHPIPEAEKGIEQGMEMLEIISNLI